MNIKTTPILIAILVFISITGFYSTNDAPSDGWTEIGFPYPFYTFTGGKIDPAAVNEIEMGFILRYFLIDLLVLALFIYVFNYADKTYKIVKK
ncbi:hypothetical protein SAMN06265348_114130 [Pedobacter westerhofensis]|uniref:Uncharacterized protein n=1 Tax=Pedobacter westerhofensis TaxID=425512 RepID=A0A521FNF6_9SPHI|nr:hypothetical protein [Pedobacter westerhofensis]SMO97664.1 hypothetical protein SAMN06265348_114130 [Pedobacter westerhofensis]